VSPAWDSKPEQKRLVDLVLAHGDIADYIESGNGNGNGNSNSSGTSREAIKKRLQRARKFLMIVELFGTTVLNAAPDVSVSRLDLVSLQLLAGLVHEGNDNRPSGGTSVSFDERGKSPLFRFVFGGVALGSEEKLRTSD
jgi:hypothetical protein